MNKVEQNVFNYLNDLRVYSLVNISNKSKIQPCVIIDQHMGEYVYQMLLDFSKKYGLDSKMMDELVVIEWETVGYCLLYDGFMILPWKHVYPHEFIKDTKDNRKRYFRELASNYEINGEDPYTLTDYDPRSEIGVAVDTIIHKSKDFLHNDRFRSLYNKIVIGDTNEGELY